MDKIICLVGESGCGKTTIAELLEKEGYNYIQSYTTRKPRFEDEKGHIFVETDSKEAINIISDNECEALPAMTIPQDWLSNEIIAYTYFDGNHYWATRYQYQGKGNSIYIIDTAGVKELKEKVTDADIVVIYIKVDESARWYRIFERYISSHKNDFVTHAIYTAARSTATRRIEHDRESFKIVQCDYVIDNNGNLEDAITLIKKTLED